MATKSRALFFFFFYRPLSFNLPLEYRKLLAHSKSDRGLETNDNFKKRKIWICKPVGLSQGKGISLFEVSYER